MGSGRNWERVRYEHNARRYGTEEATPKSAQGQPGMTPGFKRKGRRQSTLTPEQRKRWADAIRHVYGRDPGR